MGRLFRQPRIQGAGPGVVPGVQARRGQPRGRLQEAGPDQGSRPACQQRQVAARHAAHVYLSNRPSLVLAAKVLAARVARYRPPFVTLLGRERRAFLRRRFARPSRIVQTASGRAASAWAPPKYAPLCGERTCRLRTDGCDAGGGTPGRPDMRANATSECDQAGCACAIHARTWHTGVPEAAHRHVGTEWPGW